jgi:8-oxo-dGTP diphosphatase
VINRYLRCGKCNAKVAEYKTPLIAADIIIKCNDKGRKGIVLIKRKNYPFGWAIPGGFLDYGESLERAAKREAYEETSLRIRNVKQFGAYSEPRRDPRHHTVSVVFTAEATGTPAGADDAAEARIFTKRTLPRDLAFDHKKILARYFARKTNEN